MVNRILLTVVLSVFTALLGVGIVIPVLPVLAVQLGASGFALGLITAVFSLSRGALQPVVGALSDQWGRKGFLIVGLFIYGLVGLLIPQASTVLHLICIRIFQGVGAAMIVPVAMAYASFLAPPGQEGRYMSVINIALFCGLGCGPIIGGLCSDLWGLSSVFYIMAALCFLSFVLALKSIPSCSPIERRAPTSLPHSFQAMLHRRRTVGILLARFATVLMMVPTMAFLPLIMGKWPENSSLQVGLVMAGRTMMNALLQIPFGRITDHSEKSTLLFWGTSCMCIAVFCIPTMHTFLSMLVTYLSLGAGEAILWPALGAYAAEEGRTHFGHGTMMGVFNLAMSAGVFTGALLGGLGMDHLSLEKSFHLIAVSVFLLTILACHLIRSGEKQVVAEAPAPDKVQVE